MNSIIHKNPTEESFIQWMDNFPESSHWLDRERFYIFAHTVISYKATSWLKHDVFYKRIKSHTPNFREDKIEDSFELLITLYDFSKTSSFPLYTINEGNWIERKVKNGKIIDTRIENIHEYMKL